MPRQFHAVLKTRSEHTVELLFDDAPWDGENTLKNVEVELFERDKSLGGSRETTRDDALGTITVDLARGPKNKHGSPTVKIAAARFTEPVHRARIHSGTIDVVAGAETFRVPVYMEPEEWRTSGPPPWASTKRNFIELGVRISAPGKPTYDSLKPGVRPDRVHSLRGPVLTIIVEPMGSGDRFADNAEAHWTPRSDRVVRSQIAPISLQEAVTIIDEEIGFEVTWSQVNIVTHGNLAGLFMPLRRGEDYRELTALNVDELKVPAVKQLHPESSHVVIRGCSIGRDTKLLQALSQKLNDVAVYAPKVHLIAYQRFPERSGPQTKELLYRRYWAFRPGTNRKVSPPEIARLLEAQRGTMPLQPSRPFEVIVSQAFDRRGKEVQPFFRRPSELQTYTWDYPEEGDEHFKASALQQDSGLRTGRTAFSTFIGTAGSTPTPRAVRASLTQPDHAPLADRDPLWNDLDAWAERGHWGITAKNVLDKVVDPASSDPLHRIRAQVSLSRVKVEACELEGEITDEDVRTHPQFGSS